MSYCRWSSDDFSCDVYCYESEFGWQVHVAVRRVVGNVPKIDWSTPELLYSTYKAQMEFMDTAERETIGLPYDGEDFCFDCPKETAEWLVHLKETGYNVPQYAIDALMEEVDESDIESN